MNPNAMYSSIMVESKHFDVAIIGAGVLGTSIAYLLSLGFKGSIAVFDKEDSPGTQTSTRNTGVIHRPFYLDPEKKAIFAKSAQDSYPLWKDLAKRFDLPWNQTGTLEIATREEDVGILDKYTKWTEQNGMDVSEIQLFNEKELKAYEPNVKGHGAILSKTDTSVEFGSFTRKVMELAISNGVNFVPQCRISDILENGEGTNFTGIMDNQKAQFNTSYLINAASGDSLRLAHQLGLARKYAVLHFRGDYWTVDSSFRLKVKHNIYTVPKHRKYPFLDPHFILRHDGTREVGPTASLVGSPYDYTDSPDKHSLAKKILESPSSPKLKLAVNPEFLNLVRTEWRSSRSKNAMARRVRQFIPSLEDNYLIDHGLSGVRNSLIDKSGFVPEAILEQGEQSLHVLNFNSPGATGAPAFAMHVLKKIELEGFLKFEQSEIKGLPWETYFSKSF